MTLRMTGMVLLLSMALTAGAEEETATGDAADVFARLGEVELTQDLMDAAFSRIKEAHRLTFIRDGKRVDSMVKNLLAMRALANEARADGFDQEHLVELRLQLAADKELAEAWLDERVRRAPPADFEQLAQERYQANRQQFRTRPSWDLTHILIGFEGREEAEALALAEDLHGQLTQDPSRFDALVLEYSDDSSAPANRGRFTGIERGEMVEPFEQATMALASPGDISEPVRTRFGYHLIRLDGRNEPRQLAFDEVKVKLIAALEEQRQEELRRGFVEEAVSRAPLEVPEGAVEQMLKRYFGESLEKAPIFSQ